MQGPGDDGEKVVVLFEALVRAVAVMDSTETVRLKKQLLAEGWIVGFSRGLRPASQLDYTRPASGQFRSTKGSGRFGDGEMGRPGLTTPAHPHQLSSTEGIEPGTTPTRSLNDSDAPRGSRLRTP